MGADISGACGQLVVQQEKDKLQATRSIKDIEDGPFGRESGASERRGMDIARHSGKASGTEQSSNSDSAHNARDTNDVAVEAVSKWIQPLTVATSVAASCFLLSTFLFVRQKQRR